MNERSKVDLKKYAAPPVSKWYLLRIFLYIAFLTIIGVVLYRMYQRPVAKQDPLTIKQIEGVEILIEDSLR